MEKPSGEYVRHQRVNGGGTKKNSGTDDDEDVDRSGVDRGGGGSFGIDFPQAIERIRVIEQVRRKTAHRRHQQLHARQDGVVSKMTDLVKDVLPSILATRKDTTTTLPTPTVSTPPPPELSNLNIIPSGLPETSVLSILSADSSGYPDVPIESTKQVVLSSTPPPSPAETSPGMVIPTITSSSTSSTSSISESSGTNSSSTDSLLSSTIVSPYTTVTSYWAAQTARSNGTTSSDTRIASTTTIDSRVVIFTQVPVSVNVYNGTSTQTPSSLTNSSISSTWSVNSTTSTSTSTTSSSSSSSSESSTSLWPSTTEPGDGGVGGPGGGVTPTSTVPSGSPTSTGSSGSSSPVSPGLLGGVLGGVAGFAFVLMVILYLLRRHRRELAIQARDDAGYGGALGAGTGGGSGGGDGEQSMVQRSSMSPFAAAGGFFSKRSRQSQTSSETPASGEPSFVKLSGRKLPPVIGGPRPVEPPSVRSGGSSFYHDDDISWVGGPGTPVSSTGAGPSRYSGATPSSPTTSSGPTSTTTPIGPTPILPPMGTSIAGPGPSRIPEERESDPELAAPEEPVPRSTPIIRQPSAPGSQTDVTLGAPIRPPFHRGMSSGSAGSTGSGKDLQGAGEIPPAPAIPAAFARQMSSERAAGSSTDGVGRSLASRDGSRTSRFTEDIV